MAKNFFNLNYKTFDYERHFRKLFVVKLKLKGTQDTPSKMKVGLEEPGTILCL